ncbi:hypothetical protein ART_2545 [Arthrobacter sp. PAMC 25486]|nr:hypothetical protein ART_2545 [Arthrobacter sp. PAMC 25486]
MVPGDDAQPMGADHGRGTARQGSKGGESAVVLPKVRQLGIRWSEVR